VFNDNQLFLFCQVRIIYKNIRCFDDYFADYLVNKKGKILIIR